jgi:hypothetical protein
MAALTAALAALTAAGTISKFSGERNAATAAVQQGNYESSIYGQNADIAEMQAQDAIARGREAELRQGMQTKQLVGSQRASLAASGIDPNIGSGAEIQADTNLLGTLDALTIRNNAAREAWGYNVNATQLRGQAALAKRAGQNTAAGLRNQSWTTLLTGGAQLASQFPSNTIKRTPATPVNEKYTY